jgi:hypothetical protein
MGNQSEEEERRRRRRRRRRKKRLETGFESHFVSGTATSRRFHNCPTVGEPAGAQVAEHAVGVDVVEVHVAPLVRHGGEVDDPRPPRGVEDGGHHLRGEEKVPHVVGAHLRLQAVHRAVAVQVDPLESKGLKPALFTS